MKSIARQLDFFTQPGQFFKGNIHTHSNRSDGALDPEEVCRRYRQQGYDFLAITDHFMGVFDYPLVDTAPMRTENFTTILGVELHSGAMENGELWHIVAVGLPQDFAPSNSPGFVPISDQETGPEVAQRAREAGAFVIVAHPQWSALTLDDARSIRAAHAVEIYNHGAWRHSDRPDGMFLYEALLNAGDRLLLTAADDAHFHCEDYFGAWLMVKAVANQPDKLLEAMKQGDYYASQGPEINDITDEGTILRISCSPASSIVVAGEKTVSNSVHGENITEGEVDLTRHKDCKWIRVTVIDKDGKKAWSNPIYRT